MNIMVTSVSLLGSGGVVLPENGSVHLADGDEVLAVGDTEEDEAIVLGIYRSEEKKREGKGAEANKVCHDGDHRKGIPEGQTFDCCSDKGMIRLSQ